LNEAPITRYVHRNHSLKTVSKRFWQRSKLARTSQKNKRDVLNLLSVNTLTFLLFP
jgi:hypothetical protein